MRSAQVPHLEIVFKTYGGIEDKGNTPEPVREEAWREEPCRQPWRTLAPLPSRPGVS